MRIPKQLEGFISYLKSWRSLRLDTCVADLDILTHLRATDIGLLNLVVSKVGARRLKHPYEC